MERKVVGMERASDGGFLLLLGFSFNLLSTTNKSPTFFVIVLMIIPS